jgi:hypothetical protein
MEAERDAGYCLMMTLCFGASIFLILAGVCLLIAALRSKWPPEK